ncbi:PAS domain-containing protein [Hymenobacter busanensis]|uniref:histidine kinase n=1 Tax=Hymenobacter busanensis TaxID=2607656 RepID=A0A7L4ZYN3_9BACT|nr:PAS domain-containing protein [Hymenobacter busanensis]KAA9333280.1 PAS domain-containing protein [Hymenobacter busanensis]QHJ08043.1 PAS domain-containing protein [Hymenobacter busanensis]
MPATPVPQPLRSLPADGLLADLLAVSMTGVIFYTPIYDPAGSGAIVDFRFEYLNPAAQRMMGMPEVPAVTHNEQWPHSKAHGTFDFHVAAYVTGEPREYNINYQADGYDNYYRLAARRSGDGLWVSFTDTADQPRSPVEVALRESQAREQAARADAETQRQRFYEVLMQLPAHVAVHEGPGLVFTFVNPHYERIANGRELLGQPIRVVWPELADHGILDVLERVYQTGEPFVAAGLPVQADFTRTGRMDQAYYDFFFLPLRDAQDRVTGVLNFSYDVTDVVQARQQVEQLNQELETRVQERTAALQESEARFRIMADAAPNQVWAVNPDTTIRYANQAFLDFVGVSLEQYVATGWSAYLHPEELELAQHTLAEAIRTGALYTLEHRMRRHDGQYRWLLAQGAPSFYPNGELYGYVGSAIDITDLKHANARLTRTNQDLDNFVYAASHDLKQPVDNLAGLWAEVRRGSRFADPAEEQLLVPMIDDALRHLRTTIDDLATLGQAQHTSTLPAEPVSWQDLTEEVLITLEPQVRSAQARITTDFAARPTVSFNRSSLRTILLNLLDNALKCADPTRAARIHLAIRQEAGQPVLVVTDNGVGVDAAKYGSELFHLFRRFHTHTAGTGVGLYLVNRLVEANGGRIVVESQIGQGATFHVFLGRA